MSGRAAVLAPALALGLGLLAAPPASGQEPTGREAVDALVFEPLEFTPPKPERHEISGVTTLLLEDRTLPLETIMARFRGGYGLFDREWYAAAMGLPAMMRYGGTTSLPPDSVEQRLELYAIQTSFESGGVSVGSTLNTLTDQLDVSLDLWSDLLSHPRFDESEIEVWRGRELERARRTLDDPAGVAYAAFNRLLYGDHSIGWQMGASDLAPERVTPERFRSVHERVFCRDNLVLGVAGDLSWDRARPRLEPFVQSFPPCPDTLPASPVPEIRTGGGVYLIERDLDQAVVIMAHPTDVHLADDPEFFAATIGNAILGAGGLSSRLMQRVRSDEGYAYNVSSLWTTPRSFDGLVGAITRTRPENVVPAIGVILQAMQDVRETAPTAQELRTAVDRIVNGYVFNFQSADQIVSRMMLYDSGELPEDWLERYVEGVQQVTPEDVRRVFADHLHPDDMTILVVGDPERIGRERLETLGPVTVLEGW